MLIDNDVSRVEALSAGDIPIHERFLPELIARTTSSGRLSFSGSVADTVPNSSVIFIAVGTPAMVNSASELSYVEAVAGCHSRARGRLQGHCQKKYSPSADASTDTKGNDAEQSSRGFILTLCPIPNFCERAQLCWIFYTRIAS